MTETWVGRTVSKVKIQQLIGRGGMADVYIGLHTTLNVPRAVKVLHGHLTDDPELQRRFLDEAKSVAALRHAHIVQVYDFDLADGSPYIIMELLRGLPMSAYLKGLHQLGHSLTLETVARLLDRIASALDYAHSQGIIHRDVKPSNVILREGAVPLNPAIPLPADSEPVLTDFGIARISGATTQTLTGTILGTPAYMSPEQVRGETVDARSDNYSLGIMLYEMLAGALPFDPEVDTTASVLYKQANVRPPPLANTSPRIQTVVDRALRKEKDARYQKAGDLALAFREATGEGVSTIVSKERRAAHSTPAQAASRKSSIKPLWIGLAALAAIGVCVGVVGLGALATLSSQATPTSLVSEPPTSAAPVGEPTQGQPVSVAPTAPASATVAGGSLYQDSSMQAQVRDVPDPGADAAYAAWLIGPGGTTQLAGADFSQGALSISFVDPQGRNLLAVYDHFAVSLEPNPDPAPDVPGALRFVSQSPPETLVEIRRLDDHTGGDPTSQSIVQGMRSEAQTHDSHLGFALAAVESANLAAAKQHLEHTINILEGEASPAFSDWNQSGGPPENPGDGYGLIAYLRLALALTQSELQNPELAEPTAVDLRALAAQLEANLALAQDSSEIARRMIAVDSIEEIRPLSDAWAEMILAGNVAKAALQIEDQSLRLWTPVTTAP
jgi:serine/threonine protein kinase